jgi:hypothetical protein
MYPGKTVADMSPSLSNYFLSILMTIAFPHSYYFPVSCLADAEYFLYHIVDSRRCRCAKKGLRLCVDGIAIWFEHALFGLSIPIFTRQVGQIDNVQSDGRPPLFAAWNIWDGSVLVWFLTSKTGKDTDASPCGDPSGEHDQVIVARNFDAVLQQIMMANHQSQMKKSANEVEMTIEA